MNYNQEALYYGVASANHAEIAGPCVPPTTAIVTRTGRTTVCVCGWVGGHLM
jgi:hypothetical protein